jgi:hypothetical protein
VCTLPAVDNNGDPMIKVLRALRVEFVSLQRRRRHTIVLLAAGKWYMYRIGV